MSGRHDRWHQRHYRKATFNTPEEAADAAYRMNVHEGVLPLQWEMYRCTWSDEFIEGDDAPVHWHIRKVEWRQEATHKRAEQRKRQKYGSSDGSLPMDHETELTECISAIRRSYWVLTDGQSKPVAISRLKLSLEGKTDSLIDDAIRRMANSPGVSLLGRPPDYVSGPTAAERGGGTRMAGYIAYYLQIYATGRAEDGT